MKDKQFEIGNVIVLRMHDWGKGDYFRVMLLMKKSSSGNGTFFYRDTKLEVRANRYRDAMQKVPAKHFRRARLGSIWGACDKLANELKWDSYNVNTMSERHLRELRGRILHWEQSDFVDYIPPLSEPNLPSQ